MRYFDAIQMNMTKIQAAVEAHPEAGAFLITEYHKCGAWLQQYHQTRAQLVS